MARNATTKDTALQLSPLKHAEALTQVKVNRSLLKGRAIQDVSEQMTVKKMAIGQFLTLIEDMAPVHVQRNDLYRLQNRLAKHLEQFMPPQCSFALVYLNGKLYLLDGNTRKRAWLNQTHLPLPSHVFVTIIVAETEEKAFDFYKCYDSKEAKKTNRDELLSMVHVAGLEPEALRSKLVAGGKLVSVVRNMARAMSGSSASPQRKQSVVTDHIKALCALDVLNLDEGMVKGGGVWALLRLYRELPQEFHPFITAYASELVRLDTSTEHLAAQTVQAAKLKALDSCLSYGTGTSGEKAIPAMYLEYLPAFWAYTRALVNAKQAPVKLTKLLNATEVTFLEPELTRVRRLLTKLPATRPATRRVVRS